PRLWGRAILTLLRTPVGIGAFPGAEVLQYQLVQSSTVTQKDPEWHSERAAENGRLAAVPAMLTYRPKEPDSATRGWARSCFFQRLRSQKYSPSRICS